MNFTIEALRWRDLPVVLKIQRRTFSDDPWTSETLGGWLVRSRLGSNPRAAAILARAIHALGVGEAMLLVRLVLLLGLSRPQGKRFFVARVDSDVVGYATYTANPDGTEDYQSIAVISDSGRKGIGRALFAKVFDLSMAADARQINLMVKAGNDHAHRLYESFGFSDQARRPGYYQPSGSDAVLMRWVKPGADSSSHESTNSTGQVPSAT